MEAVEFGGIEVDRCSSCKGIINPFLRNRILHIRETGF